MSWSRSLLTAFIVITTAFSAFAQVAGTSNQSKSVTNPPVSPATLKSAFQDHFLIGVAINRSMATGEGGRRSKELVEKDIALVKEQFNQIAPENNLKWQLIHPREGADIAANADATQGGLVSDADQRLADAYAGIFRAFLKHRKSVKMVTFWGANDAVSWRRFGTPLLFDVENKPKPAFEAVLRVPTEAQSITE